MATDLSKIFKPSAVVKRNAILETLTKTKSVITTPPRPSKITVKPVSKPIATTTRQTTSDAVSDLLNKAKQVSINIGQKLLTEQKAGFQARGKIVSPITKLLTREPGSLGTLDPGSLYGQFKVSPRSTIESLGFAATGGIRGVESKIPKVVKGIAEARPKAAGQPILESFLTKIRGRLPKAELPGQKIIGEKVETLAPSIPQDPVNKIITALKGAKPIRGQQEKIYSQIRSQQAAKLASVGERLGGEKTYFQKLGQLKGEMPKVEFESIRKQITQPDIDSLFNKIEQANLPVFQKINAQTGLQKLLGGEGGKIPTKGELELLNEVFPPEFIKAVLDKRSLISKLFSVGENVLNIPRAIMASVDLSAPLRQGIFLVGRPKQWIPAFKNMFKYAFSEKAYQGLADNIKARPNYPLMREAKLAITDLGQSLQGREEAFMSNLTEKIPLFGGIFRGSNRAYSGFLNKLRVDTFDDLIRGAKQQGIEIDNKILTDIGSFINAATGRGNLPKFVERSAPMLNAVFFSPRLMASRINLLRPDFYVKLDPFVRKEALKSLLTFVGTAGTVLGLSKLGGAVVVTDPRNADFGKIKVGNTRYDVLGGFQQYIRLGAQLISGQIVSSTTGKIITLGEGYKPLTRKDILQRFFENKTSPIASFVIGLMTGTNSIGDKFNIPPEVINRVIPMMVQDIYDLQKEWGLLKGGLMGIPGIFGVGSQTYGKQELVTGENQLGQPTSQLRAPLGLNEVISLKLFGQQPLGTTPQYSADAYYKQMLRLPPEEAAKQFDQIAKTNPDLAKKISQSAKDYQLGITPDDETLKAKGVASGDRAMAVAKKFNDLKTKEEKAALWEEYVSKGIITEDVAAQLVKLKDEGILKGIEEVKPTNPLEQFIPPLQIKKTQRGLLEQLESLMPKAMAAEPGEISLETFKPQEEAVKMASRVVRGVPTKAKQAATTNIPLVAQALKDEGILTPEVLAYALATIEHETAGTFSPIEEYGGRQQAIRLGYGGGENFFGRGFIQLTHDFNYKKFGDRIGVDLVNQPELALDPIISAKILAAFFKDNGVANLVGKGSFIAARNPINPDRLGRKIALRAKYYLKLLK